MKKGTMSWVEFDARLYEVFGKRMRDTNNLYFRTEDLYFNVVKQMEIGEIISIDDIEVLNFLQDLREMEGELCVIAGYCYDKKRGPFIIEANELHDFVKEFYDEYGETLYSLCDVIIINFEKEIIWVLFHEGICWLTKGRIDCTEDDQGMFFYELRKIQRRAINDCLGNYMKYRGQRNELEAMLTDATYDVIVMMMELFDGYINKLIKCNVTNVKTGNTLNGDIEMQDMCADVLWHSDIY